MKIILFAIFLLLFVTPIVTAAIDFNTELSETEKQQVDKILAPIMKIYNFIKYC